MILELNGVIVHARIMACASRMSMRCFNDSDLKAQAHHSQSDILNLCESLRDGLVKIHCWQSDE